MATRWTAREWWNDKDYTEILGVLLAVVALMVAVPSMALFFLGGAENQTNLVKFFFYGIMGFSAALLIVGVRFLEGTGYFARHAEWRPFARITVHSPEDTLLVQTLRGFGGLGDTLADAVVKPGRFTLIWFVIALVFGASIAITGTVVSRVPTLVKGQITETAQLALAVEPAVFSETLFFNVALFYIQMAAIAWVLVQRAGLDLGYSLIIGKVVAGVLTVLEFLAYHTFRYGPDESALLGILFLGTLTVVLTAVTDSMIPAYLLHASGNFFKKLHELGVFTNELVVVATIVGGLLAIVLYLVIVAPFQLVGD